MFRIVLDTNFIHHIYRLFDLVKFIVSHEFSFIARLVNLLHSSAILGVNVNSYPFATINVDINANPISLNYFNTGRLIKYDTGPRHRGRSRMQGCWLPWEY